MIVGIGIDITDISRLEKAMKAHGNRFRDRIFTSGEIAYCEQYIHSAERYAVRFAAKEAARKALGAAIPLKGLSWHDVEIVSSPEGAPNLKFNGRALEIAKQLNINKFHVSLSHATEQATAFVILECVKDLC